MDNETAWLIFMYSIIIVGFLNIDKWQSLILFGIALLIGILSFIGSFQDKNEGEKK